MYRNLIPTLADRYHLVAPDLPGFGFSDAPDRTRFNYTFEHLADVIERFTESLGRQCYAIYALSPGSKRRRSSSSPVHRAAGREVTRIEVTRIKVALPRRKGFSVAESA